MIAEAYRTTWTFHVPRSCRAMHAAGLLEPPPGAWRRLPFASLPKDRLVFVVFEMDDAKTVAEGDVFVRDSLIDGLVPIGGDGSGDRFCFDARQRKHGTTPVVLAPHDGGGATYVAPSFAGFVFRLCVENLLYAHLLPAFSRRDLAELTHRNAELAKPFLLPRWTSRLHAVADASRWPTFRELDAFFAKDPAFARLPRDEFEHFR